MDAIESEVRTGDSTMNGAKVYPIVISSFYYDGTRLEGQGTYCVEGPTRAHLRVPLPNDLQTCRRDYGSPISFVVVRMVVYLSMKDIKLSNTSREMTYRWTICSC